jgi:hypothetical protein
MAIAIAQIAHLMKHLANYFNVKTRYPILLAGNFSRIAGNPLSPVKSGSPQANLEASVIHSSMITTDHIMTQNQKALNSAHNLSSPDLRPQPDTYPLYYVLQTEKYDRGLTLLSFNLNQVRYVRKNQIILIR